MTNGQHLLFYRNPARCWEEALPLGNGRIGAMVYGRADEELIELNEDTLWGGRPRSFDGGGYFEQLGEARRLLRERRFAEADEFISSHMLHYDSEGYLPAGRLKLRFAGPLPDGEYRRELELSEAVAATRTGGLLCEWFVSAPHQVLVMRCTATVPGTAGFALSLDSPLRHTVGIEAGDLFLNGVCPVHARGDEITETDAEGRGGIRFEIRARLLAEGGTVAAGAGALTASGADSILLLVAIRSDFRGWNREPAGAFPAEACRADLDRAAAAGSDALRSAHIEEHQLYYRRSSLELPEDAADALPTDERLAALYARRSGRPQEEFAQRMAENNGNGRWLSPEETVAAGLADVVTDAAGHPAPSLTRNIARGWERLLIRIGLSAGEQLPADRNILHTEGEERELLRRSAAAVRQAQQRVVPTQTRPREDPSYGDLVRTANQRAYSEDAKRLRNM